MKRSENRHVYLSRGAHYVCIMHQNNNTVLSTALSLYNTTLLSPLTDRQTVLRQHVWPFPGEFICFPWQSSVHLNRTLHCNLNGCPHKFGSRTIIIVFSKIFTYLFITRPGGCFNNTTRKKPHSHVMTSQGKRCSCSSRRLD